MDRRNFIEKTSLGTAGLIAVSPALGCQEEERPSEADESKSEIRPLAIATWNVPNATARAWEILSSGGSALVAVEEGVKIEEADKANQSVGNGGRPDRDGNVTLDACIMDKDGNYGAVLCLEQIVHAVSVARKVMEETPHVILAGKGALAFAQEQGFKKTDLLSEKSRNEWLEWRKTSEYKPVINIENHDTIGMLTIDKNGDLSGACTTSGMAYKMAGRVGDSPIIGSGLFVDNAIGAATATGMGEEVLKTVGSFLIVELMRQGLSPQEACETAVKRIVDKQGEDLDFQVGYIAVNKLGETGAYSVQPGFSYRVYSSEGHNNLNSASHIEG